MQTESHKSSQNRAKIVAVIFDLDGTIVDSNDLHVEAWNEAFQHFGKHFPMAKLRKQIGKGSDQYLPAFLPRRGTSIAREADRSIPIKAVQREVFASGDAVSESA